MDKVRAARRRCEAKLPASELLHARRTRLEAEIQEAAAEKQRQFELEMKDKDIELERIRQETERIKAWGDYDNKNKEREHQVRLEQVRADLDRARLGVTQPFELQKNLSVLTLAAWEKQERDPTFKATFANLQELISQSSSAVSNLMRDLDADGNPLDEETRVNAAAEALALVMKVLDRLINRL